MWGKIREVKTTEITHQTESIVSETINLDESLVDRRMLIFSTDDDQETKQVLSKHIDTQS